MSTRYNRLCALEADLKKKVNAMTGGSVNQGSSGAVAGLGRVNYYTSPTGSGRGNSRPSPMVSPEMLTSVFSPPPSQTGGQQFSLKTPAAWAAAGRYAAVGPAMNGPQARYGAAGPTLGRPRTQFEQRVERMEMEYKNNPPQPIREMRFLTSPPDFLKKKQK